MTSLKTSIKTITYLSDTGCLEIQGASLIVSWSLSTPPDAELVNTILDNVVETLNAVKRPVIHRDRGGIIGGRKE